MKKKTDTKPLWTPVRIASTLLVLSLLAAFGVSSCNSSDVSQPSTNERSAERNDTAKRLPAAPAPPAPLTMLPASVLDAELKATTGAPIKLSNYAGKVLVVNLWATWCGPCRVEIPELVKLHKEYRSKGLEVVGLSTEDPESSADLVKRFAQDFNMNYRVGWASAQVALTLMQGRDAIPQSFVISRSGRIVKRFVGFNQVTTAPQMKDAIEEALNEKVSAD